MTNRRTLLGLTLAGAAAFATRQSAAAREARPPLDTSRILVIGGGITEILYELGLQDRIVAVDSTSQYPAEALKTKKNVGYMRALSAEGVLSAAPTLIIASDRAGPPEVVRTLKSGPVAYLEIDDQPGIDALLRRIVRLGSLLHVANRGDDLARRVKHGLETLQQRRVQSGKPARVLFVINAQGGRFTVGGRGTSADEMLTLAGAANVASAIDGFKPVTDESILAMAPEVVLAMSRSSGGSLIDEIMASRAFQATPAGTRRRIVEVDALRYLGFGPRTPEAALDLMSLIARQRQAASGTNTP